VNSINNTLSAMIVAVLASGCASTPPGTTAATPTSAPANKAAVINAGAPAAAQPVGLATQAPATSLAAGGAEAKHQDLEKNARTMGFKPRKEKDGTTRWCKTEATLGSRFETTNCVSEDTMAMEVQEMLQTQDYMRSLQGCNGSACGSK
jgi:hypothetical protein